MTDSASGVPIADVLAGLEFPALPGGVPAKALFALVKYAGRPPAAEN